jgi:uncharacterized beta barrel domain-containing protein DUF5777
VTRHSSTVLFAFLCVFILAGLIPSRALAQTPTPPPPAPATTTADEDDDAKLRPLDPDFTVINLPTTLPLPLGTAGNFHLTHRFVGVNWRQACSPAEPDCSSAGSIASNAFGFDGPAVIQLEYRIAVMKHLEAIVARTNFGRTIQFSAKYDAIHEGGSHPFGLSGIASVEGQNNFHRTNTSGADIGYTPAIGVALSRTLGSVASIYVDPIFVHNTQDAGLPDKVNTFYVGLGARVRLMPATFVVVEVTPRASGYRPGENEFGISLEKRVGGHVFSLVFANTQATTFGQIARGANPETLYIGFNLARKFY